MGYTLSTLLSHYYYFFFFVVLHNSLLSGVKKRIREFFAKAVKQVTSVSTKIRKPFWKTLYVEGIVLSWYIWRRLSPIKINYNQSQCLLRRIPFGDSPITIKLWIQDEISQNFFINPINLSLKRIKFSLYLYKNN